MPNFIFSSQLTRVTYPPKSYLYPQENSKTFEFRFLFFYRKKEKQKKLAAASKSAKIMSLSLNKNNSLRSNRFLFLTLYRHNFLTLFSRGGRNDGFD